MLHSFLILLTPLSIPFVLIYCHFILDDTSVIQVSWGNWEWEPKNEEQRRNRDRGGSRRGEGGGRRERRKQERRFKELVDEEIKECEAKRLSLNTCPWCSGPITFATESLVAADIQKAEMFESESASFLWMLGTTLTSCTCLLVVVVHSLPKSSLSKGCWKTASNGIWRSPRTITWRSSIWTRALPILLANWRKTIKTCCTQFMLKWDHSAGRLLFSRSPTKGLYRVYNRLWGGD